VLLILAGITINLTIGNNGTLNKAKVATEEYKNTEKNEQADLDRVDNEIAKYMPNGTSGGGSGSESGGGTSGGISVGTIVGTTVVDGQTLNWYLFDTDTANGKAYLVSTPTYWIPDKTSVVRGAYTPKLMPAFDDDTDAMGQAIRKLANQYDTSSIIITYEPTEKTLNYFKSVNSQWSAQRGNVAFASMNENEKEACYLADEDIFAGIKNQVNNADGSLKGKVQSLVGGASIEQWCNAYNKQSAASSSKITCEYSTKDVPGYIYKVNGTVARDSGWCTDANAIVGNDIYGAAVTNNQYHSTSPFDCHWWLASPGAEGEFDVAHIDGDMSAVSNCYANSDTFKISLFASVSL